MRQGRRFFWGIAAAALAVGVAGAAPASASAGCVASAGKGATTVARSSQAIVLRKSNGLYYGCAFDRGKLHKLKGQTDNTTVIRHTVTVKRANGAYATKYHRGAGTIKVYAVRLGSGKQIATSDGTGFTGCHEQDDNREFGDNVTLGNLVLRSNGSIAWEFSYRYTADDGWTRVLGIDRDGSHEFDCDESGSDEDRGNRIQRNSLVLTDDAAGRITWSRAGEGERFATLH